MSIVELRIPDIGDAKDVLVVEVLVKQGDTVALEDPLITLESDKASMDVPCSAAGVVESVAVKAGDKVSAGAMIARVQTNSSASTAPDAAPSGQLVAAAPTPA